MGEVTSLQHEIRDDSVEFAALICQLLPFLSHTLLPSTQSSEVLDCLRNDVSVQAKGNAACAARAVRSRISLSLADESNTTASILLACGLAVNLDVEEDLQNSTCGGDGPTPKRDD